MALAVGMNLIPMLLQIRIHRELHNFSERNLRLIWEMKSILKSKFLISSMVVLDDLFMNLIQ